jgi:hypothetical protein
MYGRQHSMEPRLNQVTPACGLGRTLHARNLVPVSLSSISWQSDCIGGLSPQEASCQVTQAARLCSHPMLGDIQSAPPKCRAVNYYGSHRPFLQRHWPL